MSKEVFDAVAEAATRGTTGLLRNLLDVADRREVRTEILRTSEFHLVSALVGAAISADPIDDDHLIAFYRSRQDKAVMNHLRTMADLSWLRALLDDAGIAWAVVKGPFLVEHAYRRVDVRAYADLDVLVDRHRFGDALDVLEAHGARLIDRNWPLIASTQRGELSVVLPHGTLLDLHWHLVVDRSVRNGFRIDVDDVLGRRRVVGPVGAEFFALGADDAWFHTAMHAVLTGCDRLLWAIDLEKLLRVDGVPGADEWHRAQRNGWADAAAIACDFLAAVFPDQDEMASQAPRSTWRRVRQQIVRRNGLNRSLDGRFSAKLFTTWVRSGPSSSAKALASMAWAQAIKGP
ncbi:MAG: nucleotidyltransferase family protein, partial [Acidimicrobiia bacterium]